MPKTQYNVLGLCTNDIPEKEERSSNGFCTQGSQKKATFSPNFWFGYLLRHRISFVCLFVMCAVLGLPRTQLIN